MPNVAHVINRLANVLKQATQKYGLWVASRENLRKLHFINKGADQPAQTRRLISDFVVQSLESIIDKLAIHTKFKHSS